MQTPAQLSCREYDEQSDGAELRAMSAGTYHGFDYLVRSLAAWSQDPCRSLWVARWSEGGASRLAGFVSLLLVDCGTTLVITALRTHPQLQGRGVAGRLVRHALRETLARSAGVSAVRATVGSGNEASQRLMARLGMSARPLSAGLVLLDPDDVARVARVPCNAAAGEAGAQERQLLGALATGGDPLAFDWIPYEASERGVRSLLSSPGRSLRALCTGGAVSVGCLSHREQFDLWNASLFVGSSVGAGVLAEHVAAQAREAVTEGATAMWVFWGLAVDGTARVAEEQVSEAVLHAHSARPLAMSLYEVSAQSVAW
eukprot:m51a1_g12963 hypothetical protein (315) ;mRNA; f:1468-2560